MKATTTTAAAALLGALALTGPPPRGEAVPGTTRLAGIPWIEDKAALVGDEAGETTAGVIVQGASLAAAAAAVGASRGAGGVDPTANFPTLIGAGQTPIPTAMARM